MDIREAWLKYTRPAVAVAAKKVLLQVSADLEIPDVALDLTKLRNFSAKCKPSYKPVPGVSTNCPVVSIQAASTTNDVDASTKMSVDKDKLVQLKLTSADLSPMFPKQMHKKERTAALSNAQGLATFLTRHGIRDDVVRFVVGVHFLVPHKYRIDWTQ